MGKDEEIRAVIAELDGLLAGLRQNVSAINEILTGEEQAEGVA
jgi:hypothetical protein